MPRRSWPVAGVKLDGLRITPMAFVVTAAVAQIDAANERHVIVGRVGTPDHEQLLVVAAVAAHSFVEQDLTAGPVHRLDEVQILLFTEVSLIGVGSPHQTSDVNATFGQTGEDAGDLGARSTQPFIRVASPVCEVDPTTGFELAQRCE